MLYCVQLLSLIHICALGTGLANLMIAVGIASVPAYARIVRSSVLTIKDNEFVEAAKALSLIHIYGLTKQETLRLLEQSLIMVTS